MIWMSKVVQTLILGEENLHLPYHKSTPVCFEFLFFGPWESVVFSLKLRFQGMWLLHWDCDVEPVIIIWVTWHPTGHRLFPMGYAVAFSSRWNCRASSQSAARGGGEMFFTAALGTPRVLLKITLVRRWLGMKGSWRLFWIWSAVSACHTGFSWGQHASCTKVVQPDNSVIVFAQTCFLLEIFGTHGRWIKNQTPSFPFFCRYKRCWRIVMKLEVRCFFCCWWWKKQPLGRSKIDVLSHEGRPLGIWIARLLELGCRATQWDELGQLDATIRNHFVLKITKE